MNPIIIVVIIIIIVIIIGRLSARALNTARICPVRQTIPHAMESLLQGQTITNAMLLWCVCMLCEVAMLQSRLTRAAGHWQQHKASMIQPRNRTLLSMTNTSAAELYYLRHMRSCAAATMGNKGSNPSPSTALQISGADFIGRLLQSICGTVI